MSSGYTAPGGGSGGGMTSPTGLQMFNQVNLVANNASYSAGRVDTLLQNGWGIAISPGGNIWMSAEASGYTTVYGKEGNQLLPDITIPSPTKPNGGQPTGQIYNETTDFVLPDGMKANFIFAGADGVISGWNGGNLKSAIRMVNNSATASYFGIASGSVMGVNYIYLANFKAGTIDVFDKAFAKTGILFTDPSLPAGYSPFNIQKIGSQLFVAYAKVGGYGSEVHAAGMGIVDIFNFDGSFVKRFVSNGELNAPWGIAKVPANFYGADSTGLSATILIGNFGDGHINAYTSTGTFVGAIQSKGQPLVIDGLWTLTFAPATATAIDPTRLYFSAGPKGEKDGLFGYIKK